MEALHKAISCNWLSLQLEWLVNAGFKFDGPKQRERAPSDADWRRLIADYREGGYWSEIALGTPAPGEPGCTIPQHLLKETGMEGRRWPHLITGTGSEL